MSGETDEPADYTRVCPFFIDTEGYTDRDRLMFVCGAEAWKFITLCEGLTRAFEVPIHAENASRVRMMAAHLGRQCTVEPYDEEWCHAKVGPRAKGG